jgi:probable HAF family extracellular repeat protein
MLTSLAPFTTRKLFAKGIAVAIAALLGACGGGSHHPRHQPPPGPGAGDSYEVVRLITDPNALIRVAPDGINELDMVTGIIFHPEGPSRAFLYNGSATIDLGDFGGGNSQGFGINRCGHVAGWALGPEGDIPQAFLYNGTLRNLGTPGVFSQARALNDCDKVAGSASFGGAGHAFLYDGVLHDLGTLGGAGSGAIDVNAGGMVTGASEVAGTVHAFLYDRSVSAAMQDLGTLGGSRSFARALNDAGQVAGASDNLDNQLHAFRYTGGILHDLGTLGGEFSEAFEINAGGYVVGNSTLPAFGEIHGFMHDGTTMHDIGTLGGQFSEALAINAGGVVVGSSGLPEATPDRAIMWTLAGGLVDLNTRLHAPPPGLRVLRALAINNKGSIVAVTNDGLVLLKLRH